MLVLPQVLGSGHSMSEALADGPRVPHVLLLLLLAKFAFSTLSFGSGAAGGIFFPMLVLGSYLGGAFGSALSEAGIVDAFMSTTSSSWGWLAVFRHRPGAGDRDHPDRGDDRHLVSSASALPGVGHGLYHRALAAQPSYL